MLTRPIHVVEWLHSPKNVSLRGGQLDIWLLKLDELSCKPDCLDKIETTRLNNFRSSSARKQYCVAHTATREILGRYLNCAPSEVPLSIAVGGKPHIDKDPLPLFFNLSHATDTALLAVRLDHEIGIDVEIVRDMPNTNHIAKRVFREDGISQLEQAGGKIQTFFELWTHTEARQKCLGRGVFGEAVSENRVKTRGIRLKGPQCAAIAWPAETTPEKFNFYQG